MLVTRPTDAAEVISGVVITVMAHVALGVLFWTVQTKSDTIAEPETIRHVITAELLMYGEVMPVDGQLPWIANPEQAPEAAEPPPPDQPIPEVTSAPEQEVVRLNPPEQPQPPRPEQNQVRPETPRPEAPQRQDRGETNRNRPTNSDPLIGSRDGFVGGTSLSESALRNQYAQIISQLGRAIRRPAAIPDSEYERLSCRVYIRVTDAGRISSWEFRDRSGNAMYDSAVESALNSFRHGSNRLRVQSLNPEVRTQFMNSGLVLNIRP